MRDHESLFEDNGNFDKVDTHFSSIVIGMGTGVVFAGAFAVYAWLNAPMVGGELWPYIRILIVAVATMLGFPVGAIMGYIVGFLATTLAKMSS